MACRQHEWSVRYYARQGLHYMNRMAAAIASLGAKPGDCFSGLNEAVPCMWQTGMRAGSATAQAPPAAVPAAFSGAIIPAMSPPPRPQGKVQRLKSGLFLPSLVWQRQLVPLGEHACLEAAECAYDVGKMLVRLCSHQRCQERRAAGVPPLPPLLLPSPSPNSIASFSAPQLP